MKWINENKWNLNKIVIKRYKYNQKQDRQFYTGLESQTKWIGRQGGRLWLYIETDISGREKDRFLEKFWRRRKWAAGGPIVGVGSKREDQRQRRRVGRKCEALCVEFGEWKGQRQSGGRVRVCRYWVNWSDSQGLHCWGTCNKLCQVCTECVLL